MLAVSDQAGDCQIARTASTALGGVDALVFKDHFWDFEDDRVMYLMFNNYGFNLPNAMQLANGAVHWETRTKPEPLCFAFRAGDSFARLSIGNHVEMVVKYEHLIRYGFSAAMNPLFEQEVDFGDYETKILTQLRCQWGAGNVFQALGAQTEANSLGANLGEQNEFEKSCITARARASTSPGATTTASSCRTTTPISGRQA